MKDSFDRVGVSARSPLELSEMQPDVLDTAGLREVFVVLAMETTVRGILLRGELLDEHRHEHPDGLRDRKPEGGSSEQTTLRAARDALERGEADGVQIQYVHQGVEWWDTVMRTEAGFRRVRIRKVPGAP